MTISALDPASDNDTETGSNVEVRDALSPFMAAGSRLLAALIAAGPIPAVVAVVDALLKPDPGNLPPDWRLVAPEKVRC